MMATPYGQKSAPTKADKEKGKAKAPISPEFIEDTDSEGKPNDADLEGKPNDAVPLRHWDPRCNRCTANNLACQIHPNRTAPHSACVECNMSKVKCSRCKPEQEPLASGSKEKGEGEGPKRSRGGSSKRRPTVVPATEPESAGELFFVFCFFFF